MKVLLTRGFVRNADFVTSNLEELLCVCEKERFGLGAALKDSPRHTLHSRPAIVSLFIRLHFTYLLASHVRNQMFLHLLQFFPNLSDSPLRRVELVNRHIQLLLYSVTTIFKAKSICSVQMQSARIIFC